MFEMSQRGSRDRNDNDTVEPHLPMTKIFRDICVTNTSVFTVLLMAATATTVNGLSAYWFFTTTPAWQKYESLLTRYYPMSTVYVLTLASYPFLAVLRDCKTGNAMFATVNVVLFLNSIGTIITVVLEVMEYSPYIVLAVYAMLFLSGAVVQANLIQLGRDVLKDHTSTDCNVFLRWYFWATNLPYFLISVGWGAYQLALSSRIQLSVLVLVSVAGLLAPVLLVSCCLVQYCTGGMKKFKSHSQVNPPKQVWSVTQIALRNSSARSCDLLIRLEQMKQSNGGQLRDHEVKEVTKFWHVVFFLVTMFGFVFWDDTRATSFVHTVLFYDSDPHVFAELSSQAVTVTFIILGIPIYQFLIQPLLGPLSMSALSKIVLGLLLEVFVLAFLAMFNGLMQMDAQRNSTSLEELCNFSEESPNITLTGIPQTVSFYLLYIPQVVNGLSLTLVFVGTLEMILTQAPYTMHGLLIGLWYAMQSIHTMVGIIELASCAVYYWEYYILKAVIVLVSAIAFKLVACSCCFGPVTDEESLVREGVNVYHRFVDSDVPEDAM